MASTQLLPNSATSSRKQGHLEAGKKRLEEFRKKKAEGRVKKAASAGQSQSADADQHEKFSQNYEQVRDGAVPGRDNTTVSNPSRLIMDHEGKAVNSSQSTVIDSSNGMHATSPVLVNSHHALYGDTVNDAGEDEVSKLYEYPVSSERANGYYGQWRENSEHSHNKGSNFEPNDGILADGFNASDPVCKNPNIDLNIDHSSFHFESQSGESRNSSKINISNHDTPGAYIMNNSEMLGDVSAQSRWGFPSTSASTSGVNGATKIGSMDHGSAFGERKVIDSSSHNTKANSTPWHASESSSRDLSMTSKSFSNQQPFPSNDYGTTFGRSRPSFLDSLGLPRVSLMSQQPYYDPQKANRPVSFTPNFHSKEFYPSSSTKQLHSEPNSVEQTQKLRIPDFVNEELSTTSLSTNDSQLPKLGASDHLHRDHELPAQKDEDFAALEQYIEELTQEKFSLQRALDTSRNLAESLAAENSSLTESYNLQGQIVNRLKSDMERLQEDIKAHLLANESVMMEYTNAQLECNAADERAKILASEVIALEEKALRLRSNELKLEKQLENVNSEITSYKRKVSILEKERQDFQSTIDAMQEEKKLLQSKLRKASTNGTVSDAIKTSSIKRDVSTTTEDFGGEHLNLVGGQTNTAESVLQNSLQDMSPPMAFSSNNGSTFSLLPEDRRFYLPDDSGVIPNDHLRMINNINSLISELALEKEELMRALKVESSNSSKLKDLNKDLSQKLEAQTQRLELLTAQRMANENVLAKPINPHSMHDTADYADEGDEVVERVLGWIMKLFPGGPGKRRTSKLL